MSSPSTQPTTPLKGEPHSLNQDFTGVQPCLDALLQHPQFKNLIKQQANLQVKQAIQEGKLRAIHVPSKFIPRMDVMDDESSPRVVATLELPGVRAENMKLQLRDGILIISGERRPRVTSLPVVVQAGLSRQPIPAGTFQRPPSNGQSYRVRVSHELRYGKFLRGITMPPGTKREDITARFQEGMLIVTWPRTSAFELPRDAPSPMEDILVDDDENVGSLGTPVPVTSPVKEETVDL